MYAFLPTYYFPKFVSLTERTAVKKELSES